MRTRLAVPVAAVLVVLVSAGCAPKDPSAAAPPSPDVTASAEGHTSSPWEWGPSIRLTLPIVTGWQNTTINPMASYTYLSYDGGHENRFEGGAQFRVYSGAPADIKSFWVGVEGAVAHNRDSYTGGSDSYTGWSATALAGIPLGQNKLRPQLVGGAGISKYSSDGTGKNVRLGIAISPF